jgi:hypothetical protein
MPVVVGGALDAVNAHDVPAFVRWFTPAGTLDAWGMLFEGASSIGLWAQEWVLAFDVRFTDLLHMDEGLAVAVHAQVGGHGYNGPATLTFHTHDDRIDALRITN